MKTFRPYEQDQGLLLPPYLEDKIDKDDMAFVINKTVNQLDSSLFEQAFIKSEKNPGGAPPYRPDMMLKILLYGYCLGIRSCRKIARAVKRDVAFMWLAAQQEPDFNTVNRFRSNYLCDILPEIFTQVVLILETEGYIKSNEVFVDGSTFEADANKHKMVWRKNTERYLERTRKRAEETLKEIDRINKEEDEKYGNQDLPEHGGQSQITSEKIQQVAQKINQHLRERQEKPTPADKIIKKHTRQLEKDAEKLEKYEKQKKILGKRNSYSTTDNDASAMMMKNGEIRPAYNVQVMAENGFVTGLSVAQNPNDGTVFKDLLEERNQLGLADPKVIVGDAGYGHEENYEELEKREIENHLKYPSYYKEISKSEKYNFHKSRFIYQEDQDQYICPAGKELTFEDEYQDERSTGYMTTFRKYRCHECMGCQYRASCTKSEIGRSVTVSHKLKKYQEEARENLNSEKGIKLKKRRGHEVETVFGEWKRNRGFRRYQLRGLEKVRGETYLHGICHNAKRLFMLLTGKRKEAAA